VTEGRLLGLIGCSFYDGDGRCKDLLNSNSFISSDFDF